MLFCGSEIELYNLEDIYKFFSPEWGELVESYKEDPNKTKFDELKQQVDKLSIENSQLKSELSHMVFGKVTNYNNVDSSVSDNNCNYNYNYNYDNNNGAIELSHMNHGQRCGDQMQTQEPSFSDTKRLTSINTTDRDRDSDHTKHKDVSSDDSDTDHEDSNNIDNEMKNNEVKVWINKLFMHDKRKANKYFDLLKDDGYDKIKSVVILTKNPMIEMGIKTNDINKIIDDVVKTNNNNENAKNSGKDESKNESQKEKESEMKQIYDCIVNGFEDNVKVGIRYFLLLNEKGCAQKINVVKGLNHEILKEEIGIDKYGHRVILLNCFAT